MLYLENLNSIIKEISIGNDRGEKITLVGATKTMPVEIINQAIDNGLTVVAENRVQEFNQKTEFIHKTASQHFIGHLQTNKVKYLVGKVELIHSVDSFHLANAISERAKKLNVIQNVLVEVNIGGELSKSGISPTNVFGEVQSIVKLPHVCVKGLMAMLPNIQNQTTLKNLCLQMREIFDKLKDSYKSFEYLSMGMTNDYQIAIQNGSNMIRVGSKIFGKREHNEV